MEFMMAPGTEAPSEMLMYLPQFKALCSAADATHTMHNLYTCLLYTSYRLAVTPQGVHLASGGREGRMYGLVTLQQDVYKRQPPWETIPLPPGPWRGDRRGKAGGSGPEGVPPTRERARPGCCLLYTSRCV